MDQGSRQACTRTAGSLISCLARIAFSESARGIACLSPALQRALAVPRRRRGAACQRRRGLRDRAREFDYEDMAISFSTEGTLLIDFDPAKMLACLNVPAERLVSEPLIRQHNALSPCAKCLTALSRSRHHLSEDFVAGFAEGLDITPSWGGITDYEEELAERVFQVKRWRAPEAIVTGGLGICSRLPSDPRKIRDGQNRPKPISVTCSLYTNSGQTAEIVVLHHWAKKARRIASRGLRRDARWTRAFQALAH